MSYYLRHLLLACGLALGLAAQPCLHLSGVLGGEPAERGQKAPGDRDDKSLPPGAIVRLGTVRLLQNCLGSMSVTFLPDGRTLATTGPDAKHAPDGMLIFWDVRTGKEMRRLEGHLVVACAPDGKIIASTAGSKAKAIRILEVETGKEISQVMDTGIDRCSPDFCFSPDGRYLAVGGGSPPGQVDDSPLRLWEVATGKEVRRFPIRVMLGTLAFSPDGKTLATAKYLGRLDDKPIQLWDVATAKELRFFKDPMGQEVCALAFSPDGNSLVAAGNSPTVSLWDVHSGKQRWRLHINLGSALSVAFAPNGRMLAFGSSPDAHNNDHVVHLIEAATGGERCRFKGHLGSIYSVAFSPDGLLLASAAADGAPLVWDVTGRILGAGQKVTPLDAKELDAAWSDLGGEDAAKAWQAILALAARPQQAVPFLQERLPPNLIDPKRLAKLFADLDSDAFTTREQASKDLAALGSAAAPALRKLAAAEPSAEVRSRVAALLGKLDKDAIRIEELRCGRAVEVLEYVATPEAKKLLEAEAQGASESQLTGGAKAALERLAKRRPGTP